MEDMESGTGSASKYPTYMHTVRRIVSNRTRPYLQASNGSVQPDLHLLPPLPFPPSSPPPPLPFPLPSLSLPPLPPSPLPPPPSPLPPPPPLSPLPSPPLPPPPPPPPPNCQPALQGLHPSGASGGTVANREQILAQMVSSFFFLLMPIASVTQNSRVLIQIV